MEFVGNIENLEGFGWTSLDAQPAQGYYSNTGSGEGR